MVSTADVVKRVVPEKSDRRAGVVPQREDAHVGIYRTGSLDDISVPRPGVRPHGSVPHAKAAVDHDAVFVSNSPRDLARLPRLPRQPNGIRDSLDDERCVRVVPGLRPRVRVRATHEHAIRRQWDARGDERLSLVDVLAFHADEVADDDADRGAFAFDDERPDV